MRIDYDCACGAFYRGSVKPDAAAVRVAKAIAELHAGPGHYVQGEPAIEGVHAVRDNSASAAPKRGPRKEPSA